MKTSHKTRFVPFQIGKGKISIKVDAGQFIFGRNKAADFLGDSPSTIWKRMKKLESLGNITIDSSNKQYSIVTICNWEEYQQDKTAKVTGKGQASDNQVTTEGQLSDTNKNVKKDKNDKKTTTTFNVYFYRPDWISEQDWKDIITHRKKHPRKPPETERAYKGIVDQLHIAQSSGYSLAQCLDKWLNNSSWQTFKAEYMEGFSKPALVQKPPQKTKRQLEALRLLETL